MAAGSSISVTPGSGAKLATSATYTESSATVQDPKMIFGEQYQATYSVSTGPSMASANSHLLQIMAGSSLKVRLRRLEIYPATLATTVTLGFLSLFRVTSAGTGGTGLTTVAFDPADAASGATAMALPSSKGAEAASPLWQGSFVAYQVLPTSGAIQPPIILDFDGLRRKPIIIAAGTANGVVLKNITAIAGATCLIQAYFEETSF